MLSVAAPAASVRAKPTLTCRPAQTPAELEAYYAIRRDAFVATQGLFEGTDVEPIDDDPRTLHIVATCDPPGDVIGVVRCYPAENGIWYGGRLCVVERYRASRLLVGRELVRTAELLMRERGVRVFLGYIQQRIVHFFEHIDWIRVGEPVTYAGQPHQLMRPAWGDEPTEIPAAH